jgi:hypothetical protein
VHIVDKQREFRHVILPRANDTAVQRMPPAVGPTAFGRSAPGKKHGTGL